jgi:hypothetical protein
VSSRAPGTSRASAFSYRRCTDARSFQVQGLGASEVRRTRNSVQTLPGRRSIRSTASVPPSHL